MLSMLDVCTSSCHKSEERSAGSAALAARLDHDDEEWNDDNDHPSGVELLLPELGSEYVT